MNQTRFADAYFLNVRFVLIALVVIGNIIVPAVGRHGDIEALALLIFSFHIPLFAFVTGYFSKSFLTRPDRRKELLTIFGQYCVFQTLYSLLDAFWFHSDGIHYSFFLPYWMLWFILSHLCWKLLLFPFGRSKLGFIWAVLLGCAVGYVGFGGEWLSLSRTFVYFPFFLAGYRFSPSWFVKIFTFLTKRKAAIGLAALFIAYLFVSRSVSLAWLMGHQTYGQLGTLQWHDGLLRTALYGLQLASGLCLLALIPERVTFMTDLGTRTVYVFLFHGIVLKVLALAGLYDWNAGGMTIALLLATAVTVTLLLSHPIVKRVLQPLVELRLPSWFKGLLAQKKPLPSIKQLHR